MAVIIIIIIVVVTGFKESSEEEKEKKYLHMLGAMWIPHSSSHVITFFPCVISSFPV